MFGGTGTVYSGETMTFAIEAVTQDLAVGGILELADLDTSSYLYYVSTVYDRIEWMLELPTYNEGI